MIYTPRIDWETPGWGDIIARSEGESAVPSLWPDYGWMPVLGPTGTVLHPFIGQDSGTIGGGGEWAVNADGPALRFNGQTGASVTLDTPIVLPATGWSMVLRANQTSGPGMFSSNGAAATSYVYLQTGTQLRVRADSYSFNFTSLTDFSTISTYVISYDGAQMTVYKNGIQVQAPVTGAGKAFTLTQISGFGTSLTLTGDIEFYLAYARPLSASEAVELFADPYCWLRLPHMYYTILSGLSPSLLVYRGLGGGMKGLDGGM